eukprot:TRINITY_DN113754_c0_g1_i1.p1 TRINITY_DN113754_c0_g1~~TRINITY_DN113754_c0_g1_i1.p1  ORF type:complete len:190 (+),score=11.81 TRINITY_DN113754_c0_g1_i1:93-662(+)
MVLRVLLIVCAFLPSSIFGIVSPEILSDSSDSAATKVSNANTATIQTASVSDRDVECEAAQAVLKGACMARELSLPPKCAEGSVIIEDEKRKADSNLVCHKKGPLLGFYGKASCLSLEYNGYKVDTVSCEICVSDHLCLQPHFFYIAFFSTSVALACCLLSCICRTICCPRRSESRRYTDSGYEMRRRY